MNFHYDLLYRVLESLTGFGFGCIWSSLFIIRSNILEFSTKIANYVILYRITRNINCQQSISTHPKCSQHKV